MRSGVYFCRLYSCFRCPDRHLLTMSVYVINRMKVCTVIYNTNNNAVDSVENMKNKEQPVGK